MKRYLNFKGKMMKSAHQIVKYYQKLIIEKRVVLILILGFVLLSVVVLVTAPIWIPIEIVEYLTQHTDRGRALRKKLIAINMEAET